MQFGVELPPEPDDHAEEERQVEGLREGALLLVPERSAPPCAHVRTELYGQRVSARACGARAQRQGARARADGQQRTTSAPSYGAATAP